MLHIVQCILQICNKVLKLELLLGCFFMTTNAVVECISSFLSFLPTIIISCHVCITPADQSPPWLDNLQNLNHDIEE